MPPYVTIEDVIGEQDDPGARRVYETATPTTVAGLFDRGMRRHDRKFALLHWEGEQLESAPDWRLDRLVIRVALCCRERHGLEPGDRVAVFGALHRLWPVVDFGVTGFGAAVVGLEAELSDEALTQALAEAAPRIAFATDARSAERLLRLRATTAVPETVVVPEGVAADQPGAIALKEFLDFGATLDTAERAQNFRACARSLSPESAALWHFDAAGRGLTRLTHAEAVARIQTRMDARPARKGDVAYLEAPRVTFETRLAWHAFVTDGLTTLALGRAGRASEDVLALRPQRILASAPWLERAWGEVEGASDGALRRLSRMAPGSRLLRSLDRRGRRTREALSARLGEGLRCVEPQGTLEAGVASALAESGIEVA
jgi:hypothetical protein